MSDLGKILTIPYLYFMDTTNLADLCPILGQTNITCFDVVYDNERKVSILYKPADIANCSRSMVMFCSGKVAKERQRHFERWSWKKSDAHLFFVSDPYLFNKGETTVAWYMGDFSDNVPLIHPILLKFHQLLNIAFCKIIGSSCGAYAALQLSALYDEIAPWTMTLAINPQLNPSELSKPRTDLIDRHFGRLIDWSINYSNIKKKVEKGKHLFTIVQNRLDEKHYKGYFIPHKGTLIEAGIQGWTFQTPASTFYGDSIVDHHSYPLNQNTTYAFFDWISTGLKEAMTETEVYKLYREF